MNIKEKVAYLQGLTQGLNVSENTSEGKVLLNIVDVLGEMADEFHNMNAVQEDLESYIETIDEDLNDLEKEIYEDEQDENLVETKCPNCKETVIFESDILEDDEAVEVTCPYCGDVVYDNTADDHDFDSAAADANTQTRAAVPSQGLHPGV